MQVYSPSSPGLTDSMFNMDTAVIGDSLEISVSAKVCEESLDLMALEMI